MADVDTENPPADDISPEVVNKADDPDAVTNAIRQERQRARDEEKARKAAEQRAQQLEAELETFRRDAMSDTEKAIEQARKEAAEAARQEVLADLRGKQLSVEIKAAATGKFADPEDAVAFLSASDLDPDDPEAISAAVDELLTKKPHLKAGAMPAPTGDIDQGARDGDAVRQLTREDLGRMSPEDIVKAEEAGQLNRLLGRD